MKLTIFAASGGIGSQILEQAMRDGHEVTAVLRNPRKLTAKPDLRVVTADMMNAEPKMIEPSVEGADGVLSGLGASSNAEAGIATRGTQAIVHAMEATGVRRVVVVSAAPVGTVPSPGRPNPPRIARKTHYKYLKRDPEFAERIQKAYQSAIDDLEAAGFERALHGTEQVKQLHDKPARW